MIGHSDHSPYLLLHLALWNYYDLLHTRAEILPVEGHYTKCVEIDYVQKPQ